MKKITFTLLLLIASWQATQAQDMSMYKALNDSAYQTMADYQAGNKYQKDAILFMDMVADTHPYYIKPERRSEWFAKKPALMEKCKTIETDEDFVDALIEVLGPLHDKHTDLSTMKRIQEMKKQQNANQQVEKTGAIDREHIMRHHDSYYDYQLFTDKGICYLQFNNCANAPDYPFSTFINDMFAKMDEEGIKTLVVDMQYNGGGNSRLCTDLFIHLYPLNKMKFITTYIRYSDFLATYYPKFEDPKKNWEKDGHVNELYQVPAFKIPADFQQPKLFEGQVVFVMGKKTYSSAGILITYARDNHVGTIIGTTSTFGPSHYGEVLPYRLPNTDVIGGISCKYFARPDESKSEEPFMQPDIELNLEDKDAAWQFIVEKYGKSDK